MSGDAPRGYVLAFVQIVNDAAHIATTRRTMAYVEAQGGRYLAMGGRVERIHGRQADRVILIEFESYAAALACMSSDEMAALNTAREGSAFFSIQVVEGVSAEPAPKGPCAYGIAVVDEGAFEADDVISRERQEILRAYGGETLVLGRTSRCLRGRQPPGVVVARFAAFETAVEVLASDKMKALDAQRSEVAGFTALVVDALPGRHSQEAASHG